MKCFLKTGLLIIFMLAFSIPAFANSQNWERIYPDAPNIYLDTNNVAKSPEGDIIFFLERTDFSTPYYNNRAFELETIAYMPRTSEWRGVRHAYFDINRNLLEQHDYSLQTTPWTKVNSNDAVIKRIMEIANGDSVIIIGNQSPAQNSGNQPATVNRKYLEEHTQGDLIFNGQFQKVEGYGSYEGGTSTGVQKIRISNLVCNEPSSSQIGHISIGTNAGKVFDIWVDSTTKGDNYATAVTTHRIKVWYNGGTVFIGKPFNKKRPLAANPVLPIPEITLFMDSQNLITMQLRYKDGSIEEFSQGNFDATALNGKISSSFLKGNIQMYN